MKILTDKEILELFSKFSAEKPNHHPTEFARIVESAVIKRLKYRES